MKDKRIDKVKQHFDILFNNKSSKLSPANLTKQTVSFQ